MIKRATFLKSNHNSSQQMIAYYQSMRKQLIGYEEFKFHFGTTLFTFLTDSSLGVDIKIPAIYLEALTL